MQYFRGGGGKPKNRGNRETILFVREKTPLKKF